MEAWEALIVHSLQEHSRQHLKTNTCENETGVKLSVHTSDSNDVQNKRPGGGPPLVHVT